MDSALYASFFKSVSGKQCVVYKSVVENSMVDFEQWLHSAVHDHGHTAFTFVGAPSSKMAYGGVNLGDAGRRSTTYLYTYIHKYIHIFIYVNKIPLTT